MIVSPERGYVFVHIPKTGGTALTLALEARAKKDDILIADTPKARRRRHRLKGEETRGRLWKHSTLADIDGLLAPGRLEGLFAFTLVRNPWDRVVSYYHWLQDQSFDHPDVVLAKRQGFADFVTDPRILASLGAHPASRYMTRADGAEQCNAYIRIEHFAKDAETLFAHLGFTLTLPPANESARARDYRRYFSKKTAGAIGVACAEDIARFGYRFG